MKMKIDKRFLREFRARFEGYNLRVGILKDRRHVPAAPKSAGHVRVLGGPARKTLASHRAELRKQVKKLKIAKGKKGAKARAKAKIIRAKIRSASNRIRQAPKLTLRDVARNVRRSSGINFFRRPFETTKSSEYKKFIKEFIRAAAKRRSMSRAQKLLLDVVRAPILKKKYGRNRRITRDVKGFDRRFIDTGQMVLGLDSEIKKRGAR